MKARRLPSILYALCVITAGVVASNGSRVNSASLNPIRLRRDHRPLHIHKRVNQTTTESYNWSGYAVTGPNGSVTEVKGSWVVPPASCSSSPDGYAAFWTGIDGWSSNTVEQIGTDSDCVNLLENKLSTPTYYAWFEFYPQDSYLIGKYTRSGTCESDCVSAGDIVSAEVQFSGTTTTGPFRRQAQQFTVTITDETQNWVFTTTSSVPGAEQSSAEWIAETPYGCNTASGYCQLSDFGTLGDGDGFTDILNTSEATINDSTQPIGAFGNAVQQSVMVNYPSGSTTMAQPSGLLNEGTSFQDSWQNSGP